jgi:hypothetical protein
MRLNFSGVPEDRIVEGVRRIGEVIAGQLDLWRTMTGEHRTVTPPGARTDEKSVSWLASERMKRAQNE